MSKRIFHIVIFTIAAAFMVGALFSSGGQETTADNSYDVSGWGWSDTVGWVSFSCEDSGTCGSIDYGVEVDGSGFLSGYAWSSNIGWVTFNSDELSGCPQPACNARVDDGKLKGWAKALAANGNGWDGFISLSSETDGSTRAHTYGPTVMETESDAKTFEGFVWGGDVVGWMQLGLNPYEPAECNDGIDNDGDGWTDFPADPGCSSSTDDSEFNEPTEFECSDAVDNDDDGLIDGHDPGCLDATDDDEEDPKDFVLLHSNDISATLIGEDRGAESNKTTIRVDAAETFTSPVSLSVSSVSPSLPGATYTFSDQTLNTYEYESGSEFSVAVPDGTSGGEYTIIIQGEGEGEEGELTRTTTILFTVETKDPQFENF